MAGARLLFAASAAAALSAAPLHAQTKSAPPSDADRDAVCFVASAYLAMISETRADTMSPDELRRTSAFHYVMPFYAARLLDRFDDAQLASALAKARVAIKTMDQPQTAASCMNDYKAAISRVQDALRDKGDSEPSGSPQADPAEAPAPVEKPSAPTIVELPMPTDSTQGSPDDSDAPKRPSWYSDRSDSR